MLRETQHGPCCVRLNVTFGSSQSIALARVTGTGFDWIRMESIAAKPVDNIRQEQNNSIMIFPLYKPLPHRL
jgi:hypothetical protein